MITYVKGNIFESPAQVITNTVNTVGAMGKGIALEYKKRYPRMYNLYKELCADNVLEPGKLALWKGEEKWVLLFPTKENWRSPSKIEYIEKGLIKFCQIWDKLQIDSIAFPKLGCGNGGLSWETVKPLMEKYLKKLPINIYIYIDYYEPNIHESDSKTEIEKWILGEAGLSGYERFRTKLVNSLSNDKSLQSKYNTIIENGRNIVLDGQEVDDEYMLDVWDMVKSSGIVLLDEIEPQIHFRTILRLMDLTNDAKPIFAAKDESCFGDKPNAYQYVARG